MSQPRPIDRQALIRTARLSGLVSLAALGLSACASVGPSNLADAGGSGGAGQGPSARSGLHGTDKPYEVAGRWYYPHAQPDYDVVGMASWYGAQFHNHHTADGEIFDQWGLSAAHKTLPLPCIVEVTNLENGKRMRLRVNDRGPFVDARVIDVSRAAAESLGFRDRGVTRVRVRYVGPAPALPTVLYARADQTAPPTPAAQGGYVARDEIEQVPATPQRPADDASDTQPTAPTLPPPSPLMPVSAPASAPPPPQPSYTEADDETAPPPSGPVGYAALATPVQQTSAPPLAYAEAAPQPAALQPAAPPPVAPVMPPPAATPPASAYSVQAAAFASYDNAQRAASRLAQAGAASIRTTTNSQGQTLYRVVVAGYPDADAAEAGRARIAAAGFGDARVISPF